MPCEAYRGPQPRRQKNNGWRTHDACAVARKVGAKERESNIDAKASMTKESNNLAGKVWILEDVKEWADVKKELKPGHKAHVGNVFGICVEKGSELDMYIPDKDGKKIRNPNRKFKGRYV